MLRRGTGGVLVPRTSCAVPAGVGVVGECRSYVENSIVDASIFAQRSSTSVLCRWVRKE
jgi:hypothetical protein